MHSYIMKQRILSVIVIFLLAMQSIAAAPVKEEGVTAYGLIPLDKHDRRFLLLLSLLHDDEPGTSDLDVLQSLIKQDHPDYGANPDEDVYKYGNEIGHGAVYRKRHRLDMEEDQVRKKRQASGSSETSTSGSTGPSGTTGTSGSSTGTGTSGSSASSGTGTSGSSTGTSGSSTGTSGSSTGTSGSSTGTSGSSTGTSGSSTGTSGSSTGTSGSSTGTSGSSTGTSGSSGTGTSESTIAEAAAPGAGPGRRGGRGRQDGRGRTPISVKEMKLKAALAKLKLMRQ